MTPDRSSPRPGASLVLVVVAIRLAHAALAAGADRSVSGLHRPAVSPTTGVLSLRQLRTEATLVVDGIVAATERFDADRLRVYRITVERRLAGPDQATTVAVVEMRGATARPGILADGSRAVLLLRPAPPLSYLTEHLPNGTHYVVAGGRDGVLTDRKSTRLNSSH